MLLSPLRCTTTSSSRDWRCLVSLVSSSSMHRQVTATVAMQLPLLLLPRRRLKSLLSWRAPALPLRWAVLKHLVLHDQLWSKPTMCWAC